MKILLGLFLIVSFVSCSGSKSVKKNDNEIELSDASEFTEEVMSDDIIADEALANAGGAPIMIEETMGEANSVYTVQANETLMMIAFKIYGDYRKWKMLASWNQDKLSGDYKITEGMSLNYSAPAQEFVWQPEGNPYLIKRGDTLGTISTDTYGMSKYWKEIWQNNKALILDPNKIFAGFTIYTPNLDSRDVANI